jgi:HEAT repeat protein
MKFVVATALAIVSLLAPCASQQAGLEAELITLRVLQQNPLRPELVNRQLYIIAQMNSDDSAKALEKLVTKLPETHRYIAIMALGLNESEEATKALRRMAKERGDLQVRRQAVSVLAGDDQNDLDFLHSKRLKYESDLRVRALILELLMKRGRSGLDKAFLTAAKSKDTVYAGVGLEGIGKQKLKLGLKFIHGALTHQDVRYRLTAYEALASYGGGRQYDAIIEGLQDSINMVVLPEISAQLQRAQTPDEVEAIISNCMRSSDRDLVTICVEALVVVSDKQPKLCSDALLKLMGHSEDKIRSLSIEGLVKIKHPGLQHLLVEFLDHSSAQTRSDAAWGLSQLGDIPPETEIKLVKMASSERPSIRIQALCALRWFPNSDLAYQVINDCLEDELWAVRATAVSSLELFRRDESLKPLFWLMENEVGRVRSDVIKVLELLTGENFGESVHTWKAWYADQSDDYTLPAKEQVNAMLKADTTA